MPNPCIISKLANHPEMLAEFKKSDTRENDLQLIKKYNIQLHGKLENLKKLVDPKHKIKLYTEVDNKQVIEEIKARYQNKIEEARAAEQPQPTQIKSATANTGAFDAGNPDIRFMIVPAGSARTIHYEDVAKTITDKRKLWAATGVEKLDDGRYVRDTQPIQIPDETIKAFRDALDGEENIFNLGDIVDLGEIANLYPQITTLPVEFVNNTFEEYGAYDTNVSYTTRPDRERIYINAGRFADYQQTGYYEGKRPSPDSTISGLTGTQRFRMAGPTADSDIRRVLRQLITHEIQHWVQQKENWQPGVNLKAIIKDKVAEKYQQILAEGNPKNQSILNYIQSLNRPEKVMADRRTNPIAQEIYREAYENYLDAPGETEARNSAIRSGMSDAERAATPISESGDDVRFMAGATLYTPTTPEQKETRKLLDSARAEYDAAKGAYERKRTELMKSYKQGVVDLFGQTPEERIGMQKLFDEKPQLKAAEKALQPYKVRMDKAATETNRLFSKYQAMEKEASKQMSLFMAAPPTRDRKVLREDQHGKLIVWEQGDYFIAIDDDKDARYITLWNNGQKVGTLDAWVTANSSNDGRLPNGKLLSVRSIDIDKKHRGQGLSKEMYKALIDFSNKDIKGLVSYLPNRVNKKQVPRIWNQMGAETIGDYDVVRFMASSPTQFKNAVKKNKDEIYQIIIDATGAGPFDGGCYLAAKAIQKAIGGNVVVLERKDGTADHAAVEKDGLLYDMDGALNPEKFIEDFNEKEMAKTVGYRPYKKGDLPEATTNEADENRVAELLTDQPQFMAGTNQAAPIASDYSNIYPKVYAMISAGMSDAQMIASVRAALAVKGLDPLLADNIVARAMVNYQKQLYSNPQPGSPLTPVTQVSDTKKGLLQKTADFLKQNFTSSEGMPTWFKELSDYARGESQWIVRKAENFLKQQLTPAFKKMTPEQQQGFAELIADKNAASANVLALTPEHKRLASEYRQHIDRLTNEFIVNGWVTPLQAQTLLENMGSYLNRSYRIFNEKDWAKKIPENIKMEALNFLKEQIFTHDSPNNPGFQNNAEAERLAQLELQRLLSEAKSDKFGFKTTEFGMDKGILKRRQDVPDAIRKLYGEYVDPAEQFIMTVAKLASLRMQAKYLTDIFNMGMGKVFWAKDDPNADPRATELVAAEGSPSWAPLSGLYATPEVAQYINESHEKVHWFMNGYRKFAGTIKAGKTVYSPITQAINLFSNVAWYVANGYYLSNPVTQAKDIGRTTKLWFTNVFANSKATDYWNRRMIELGLFDGSVTIQDLKNMFAEGDADSIMIQAQSNIAQAWTDKIKSGLRDNVITRSYQMSDAASKFVGWRKESEALAWVRHNKDYDDLSATDKEAIEKEAAERVRNTQPTGQRAYRGALWLSKNFAIFGNFITFQIEAIRSARNVVHYALHDIKEGTKNGNAREVMMGTRRLVGIAGYLTLRGAVLKGLSAIGGMAMSGLYSLWNDDDEEKKKRLAAINAIGRPYMRSMDKYMTQNEDGTWEVYNLNALEPMNVVFKIPNAFTNGNELVDDPGALAALAELVVPYAEPDMIVNSFSRTLIGEKDAMGREVYGPIDKMATIAHDLMPSAVPFVQRLFKKEDGRQADWSDIFTEMQSLDVDFDPRQLVGIRPYRVDPMRSFKTYLRDRLKDADAIKKREWENNYKRDKKDITDEQYFAEKQAIKEVQVALGDDIATMKNHAAVLGVNEAEMNKIIKNMMDISKYDKTTINAAKK